MVQHILPGEPPVTVHLRRSAQARRISLRVSRLDGRVTLTLPKRVSEREALEFATSKALWIRKHLADRPDTVVVDEGADLPLQGELLTIKRDPRKAVSVEDDLLLVPEKARHCGRAVQAFVKEQARVELVNAADHYAGQLGQSYSKITLRDTRSRWGSCSSKKALLFSWRLVLAPREVLRYVAAHEAAHLVEMNHSVRFWALVEKIYGPHQAERSWLRQHGEKLHRYQFDG